MVNKLTQSQKDILSKVPNKFVKQLADAYMDEDGSDPIAAYCMQCVNYDVDLVKDGCSISCCALWISCPFKSLKNVQM